MKLSYDPEVDILTLTFSDARIRESDEVESGLIVDYGFDDKVVGLEILHASKSISNPGTVELENVRPAIVASHA